MLSIFEISVKLVRKSTGTFGDNGKIGSETNAVRCRVVVGIFLKTCRIWTLLWHVTRWHNDQNHSLKIDVDVYKKHF